MSLSRAQRTKCECTGTTFTAKIRPTAQKVVCFVLVWVPLADLKITVDGRFKLYGIAYRGSPRGSLLCYCCDFSCPGAQGMKGHVESIHNDKRSVAIITNMDETEKENLSLAVKREQVPNPSRGILSPVQPQADVIYVRRNPTPSSAPIASLSSDIDLSPSIASAAETPSSNLFHTKDRGSTSVAPFDVDLSPLVASSTTTAVAIFHESTSSSPVTHSLTIPPLSPPKQIPAPTSPSSLEASLVDENDLIEPALAISSPPSKPSRAALTPVSHAPSNDVIYVRRNPPLPSTDNKRLRPPSNDSELNTEKPTTAPSSKRSVTVAPAAVANATATPIPNNSSTSVVASPVDKAQQGPTCSKCGEILNVGQNYHDRMRHQEKVTVSNPEGKIIIHRCVESGRFTCPLCRNRYHTQDPERLRVFSNHTSFFSGKSEYPWG
jgi:hypothetical protein